MSKRTGNYTEPADDWAHLMTVEAFRACVASGGFIDYDGDGHAVKDGMQEKAYIKPSRVSEIPSDATHINWYNR